MPVDAVAGAKPLPVLSAGSHYRHKEARGSGVAVKTGSQARRRVKGRGGCPFRGECSLGATTGGGWVCPEKNSYSDRSTMGEASGQPDDPSVVEDRKAASGAELCTEWRGRTAEQPEVVAL